MIHYRSTSWTAHLELIILATCTSVIFVMIIVVVVVVVCCLLFTDASRWLTSRAVCSICRDHV